MGTLRVNRSALVERPATMMFDLIEAAEDYPKFLPWCAGATILERSDEVVAAILQVQWMGLSLEVGTRNPKRRPEHMAIHLQHGPFRRFEGQWSLRPLSDRACKVTFELECEFDSGVAAQLAGLVFARIADTLVDAFVSRALTLPLVAPGVPDGVSDRAPSRVPAPAPPDASPTPLPPGGTPSPPSPGGP